MIHPLTAARAVPRRTWLRWRFAYLVLLPTLVLFTYLRVFPTAWAFVMSFFEWGLVKPAEKFGARYATLGFNDVAQLDDGDLWPTEYAVADMTSAVEKTITALVAKAVG